MNNIQKRFLLFLIGCITTRLLLVYISKNSNIENLKYIGYLTLIPAFGFIYIYLNDLRRIGNETFGDKIWWNNLRPLHSILYFMFSYMAINQNPNAWIILFLDVCIGLFSFLLFHYNNNNFSKLLI